MTALDMQVFHTSSAVLISLLKLNPVHSFISSIHDVAVCTFL